MIILRPVLPGVTGGGCLRRVGGGGGGGGGSLWAVAVALLLAIIIPSSIPKVVVVAASSSSSVIHYEPLQLDDDQQQSQPEEDGSNVCNYDGGTIHWSHPMSIDAGDRFYSMGHFMMIAAQMSVKAINDWPRCGLSLVETTNLSLAGGRTKNYSITLHTYGDASSRQQTAEIATALVKDYRNTDFMLAGFTSGLTSELTPIAQANQRVVITGASANTNVHANKSYIFGMLPPTSGVFDNALEALSTKYGAETVAVFTRSDENSCVGVPQTVDKYNLTLVEQVVVDATRINDMNSTEKSTIFEQAALNISAQNPDVMITCLTLDYEIWNQAMRTIDWTPKAQIYSVAYGTPEFEQAIGPIDLPYLMGVSAWDPGLPPIPDPALRWTPKEFFDAFERTAFRRPTYHFPSQAAAVSILAQAIQQVGVRPKLFWNSGPAETNASSAKLRVWNTRVQKVLASGRSFSTVYGNVSFDKNGQNEAPFLLLQYDNIGISHVLYPTDRRSPTEFQLVYPMPTWSYRDCFGTSFCQTTNGTCTSEGICQCRPGHTSLGIGPTARCIPPFPETDDSTTTTLAIAIAVPVAFITLVVAGLFVYYQQMQAKNDSVWIVDRAEVKFADPPEIVGRGSCGLVFLAEFRGTEVAVKWVLPPDPKDNANNQNNTMRSIDSSIHSDIKSIESMQQKNQQNGGGVEQPKKRSSRMSFIGKEPKKRSSKISRKMGSKLPADRNQMEKDFIREMRCVSKLRHPGITTVMGAIITPDPMLILEYMHHGSLYDLLHNNTMALDDDILLPMLQDVSQGCRFLHAAKPQVIHGDLKSANVLVDNKFRAKVTDFGMSQKKQKGATGTLFWMAPELLRQESVNTAASDVYSYGIILYEAYSRKDPYEGDEDTVEEIIRKISDPTINKRPQMPAKMPPQLASLMSDCLVSEADERPTFEELDKRLRRIEIQPDQSSSTVDRTTVSLFDIFPRHIAEALRDGKQVEPEHKDIVTIFFSDIVGFTTISSQLPPRKVANLLDRLYRKFDDLSQKHDIFKVETIGDAYMAVTNLVKDQPDDHVKRIVEFAVDALQAANETLVDEENTDMGFVNIRVGFHSGPVVADVVGTRNPRYCLFGDTVNTASRMESNSKMNRILCSKAAADVLKQQNCIYPIRSRGEIEVKGKGVMKTYWVEPRASY